MKWKNEEDERKKKRMREIKIKGKITLWKEK